MIGPQKTNLGKFQGFGLKVAAGSAGSGPRPSIARRPPGGAKPGGGVAALFKESLDDDGTPASASSKAAWSKPTVEALQAQRHVAELMAADPSVFQYDEIIDEIKHDREEEAGSQVVRTDVMTQKKRVGLTVPKGAASVASGTRRQVKYIEKVIVATDRRRVEQQITEDKLLKKEKDARKDAEVFVTEAFKEELKKRQKFVDELEEQDVRDNLNAAEKQEHGKGFADMYRNLLNGGLATSRGGEKVLERAAPRSELKEEAYDEKPKVELKEEVLKEEEEEAEEKISKDAKHETESILDEDEPRHGVVDVAGDASRKRQAEEELRGERAASARERFLARKKQALAANVEASA